jgi:hypothetical protein
MLILSILGVFALDAPRALAQGPPFAAQGTYFTRLQVGHNFTGEISGRAATLGRFGGTFDSAQHGDRLVGTLFMEFRRVTLVVEFDLERASPGDPFVGTYEIVDGATGSGEAFAEDGGEDGVAAFGLSGTIDR